MIESSEHAPDFAPGYPSGGARIGPAWCAVWTYLQRTPGAWWCADEIAGLPNVARHGLVPKTITGLLQQARRAGLLDVEYRTCGAPLVRRARYRLHLPPSPSGQLTGSARRRPALAVALLAPRGPEPDEHGGWYWSRDDRDPRRSGWIADVAAYWRWEA